MRLGQRQQISQATRDNKKKHTKVGLRVVEERIPHISYHRKMVSPQGNVVRVVLATGRGLGGTTDNPYGNLKLAEKKRAGWLLYSECPLAHGVKIAGQSVCAGRHESAPGIYWVKDPNDRWALIEDECCPHIEQAIKERQADHRARQDEADLRYQTKMDLLIKELEGKKVEEAEQAVAKRRGRPPKSDE